MVVIHSDNMKSYIKSISAYLPQSVLTNEMLARQYPAWSVNKIESKTGIKKRHIADDNEYASDMAVASANKIFASNIINKNIVDYILLCTQSPDYLLPTTACIVQDKLGLPITCGALDFNLGCSGYIYGLSLAKGLIETNQASNILLITSETYSKYINTGDKSVRSLFGDGATTTLVSATNSNNDFINSFVFGTDGSGANNLMVPHGGSCHPIDNDSYTEKTDKDGNIRADKDLYMNGSEILVFTLKIVPQTLKNLLDKAKLSIDDIDFFVFHQANQFLLQQLQKKLKIPNEKFLISYMDYGNTVSSTIPLGLLKDYRQFKHKDKIVLLGFGVGYSWGGVVISWNEEFLCLKK